MRESLPPLRTMRPPAAGRRSARRRGFVLITMIASIVVVLAVVGLAIDSGHLQLVKVRMQTAADAAALGAVNELKAAGSARLADAGYAGASANGFINGKNGVTVTINNPPSSGYYVADQTAVEAVVQERVGTYFMGLLHFDRVNVTARSVARRGSGPNCLYVLDPAASGALSSSGGAVTRVNCGIMVDSTNSTAITLSGGASLYATSITVGGGVSRSGGATISQPLSTYAAVEADPLASLASPSAGACTQTNYSISSGAVTTISEGVYCNGISVSGGASLHLNPGTYVLKGGGLTVAGQSTLTGSGVTFYVTSGGGYSYGPVSLSGGATIQLSAPANGSLTGILFFEDRSVPVGSTGSTVSGGAGSYFSGALYFPTTALSYSGNTATDYTILVARRVTITGGSLLNSDYSSLVSGSPIKGNAVLSE